MNRVRIYLLITVVAGLFFIPFLGGVRLFDWDEINFAEAAREMLVTGNYLRVHIDFQPFWEKPPLFFWLQALSMKLFGIGEFAARFPNAICGILTLLVLFHIGLQLRNARFGLLWAGAYFGSVLPHLYFRSGIIDPWFNLFIFLGINGFIFFRWKHDHLPLARPAWVYLVAGGLLLGLGILTKGPVAFLLAGLTLGIYWATGGFRWSVGVGHLLAFALLAWVPPLLWVGIETARNGTWFVEEFVRYSYRLFSTPDAGHGGFPGYHVVVLLLGCFPASIFALRGFGLAENPHTHLLDYKRWMVILFWVVLVLFSIVKSKIVHYSSLAYFPITYLAAQTLYGIFTNKIKFSNWMKISLLAVGGLVGMLFVLIPFVGQRPELLRPFLQQDAFAAANLEAAVSWTGLEASAGLVLLLATGVGVWLLSRQRWQAGTGVLFGGTALFVTLTLWQFIGRIEGYSQAAAMRFFERFQGKDVYIVPYGYRSYGPFFYARQQPGRPPQSYDRNWLLHSPDVDKPMYVITKNTISHQTDTIPTLRRIGAENGFVFYQRIR